MDNTFAIWERYFSLQTVGDLRRFSDSLELSIPEQAALGYYISTWSSRLEAHDDASFSPAEYLAPDRSAVRYGHAPVIFEGTNLWSWKPYFATETLLQKLSMLSNVLKAVRDSNPDARITLLLIPEKDYVISRFILKEDRFNALENAVGEFRSQISSMGIHLIYDRPFHGIDRYQKMADFDYKDSHLPGAHYLTIFGFAVEALGVSWSSIKPNIDLQLLPAFGDLADKFENGQPEHLDTYQPNVIGGQVQQSAGSISFADPLGETWQEFDNAAPLVDQTLCLLGDSHSSIYAQRKLTYMFANVFRRVHFAWNPCGIRNQVGSLPFDNIVLEISSRFTV